MYSYSLKLLLISLMIFMATACSDSKPEKLVSSFSNDLESNTIDLNRTISMKVYALYSDGSSSDVTSSLVWSSSDTTVATVSEGHISSSSKIGSTTVSYETLEKDINNLPFYKGSEQIEVSPLTLTAISVSPTGLSLYEGSSADVVATGTFVNPVNSEVSQQNITYDALWHSLDENIATVSEGHVIAIAEGTTTITVSDKNITALVAVEVKKIHFTKIEISSITNEFNAQQTISLSVLATTDTDETVVLNNSDILYESEDTSIVTLNGNIATAVAIGNSEITATLLLDNSFTSSETLFVLKENYVRIFKGERELDLSYSETTRYDTLPDDLDTFTLRAVGEDSSVLNLQVKDGDGVLLSETEASFDNLSSGDTLYEDENLTFTLIHNGRINTLDYSFELTSDPKTTFFQRYESLD